MRILGVNCLNHDAAISVIENGQIKFAAHSERYSRKKNDMFLNDAIVEEALKHGVPDKIAYYERPFVKKARQAYAGQWSEVFNTQNLPGKYLKKWFGNQKINYIDHHFSHAAAGYYTSPYDEAAIVVLDGIGEWDVLTVWHGKDRDIKKVFSIKYPNSLGLFYSAMTQRVGLKPCEEEYILMGMSAWGDPKYTKNIKEDFFDEKSLFKLKYNLHKGVGSYRKDDNWSDFDIAASTQELTEILLERIFLKVKSLLPQCENLVYMGGVALNCVANSKILPCVYDDVWIMPNPGDAGSSLGAAAALHGEFLQWSGPFLGTKIGHEYPVQEVLQHLLTNKIVGVANGRAEFGPRALGNRSLLADPRGDDIKDKVNEIKKRQKFRPFAPAIMEEHASEYFDMPVTKIPYMQYIATCKQPENFPAICHIDGTSRVQTVSRDDNPGFYSLLESFYNKTGCPMLLNTSLNIKGQPIVNNLKDAQDFESHYGVKVVV